MIVTAPSSFPKGCSLLSVFFAVSGFTQLLLRNGRPRGNILPGFRLVIPLGADIGTGPAMGSLKRFAAFG